VAGIKNVGVCHEAIAAGAVMTKRPKAPAPPDPGLPAILDPVYQAACRALAEAVRIDEVKNVLDVEVALRICARQAKNRQAEADCVALRMRALRTLDQMRVRQKESIGLAKGGEQYHTTGLSKNPVLPTLAMQGIDKNLAHHARVLGALSDDEFKAAVTDARDKVAHAVRNLVREVEIQQKRAFYAARAEQGCSVADLEALAASGYRAAAIYGDPPWRFDGWSGPTRPARSPDAFYQTQSVDAIMRLPVAPLAVDDCALILWCTGPHIASGSHVRVIEAWGFRPSTLLFVWKKTNADGSPFVGEGHWTRSNAEVCVLGLKGSPRRLANDVLQVVTAPVGEHSAKPEEVRHRIERLFPGPYLELYARPRREPPPGWRCWGNEIQRANFGVASKAEAAE
jgi:N6-adenosine-specific RNA methylase IME4